MNNNLNTQEIQQGDVILRKINSLPTGVVKTITHVVQWGETTGHKHQFLDTTAVNIYMQPQAAEQLKTTNFRTVTDLVGDKYIEILRPTVLSHDTHYGELIPAGIYALDIVRVYNYLTRTIEPAKD